MSKLYCPAPCCLVVMADEADHHFQYEDIQDPENHGVGAWQCTPQRPPMQSCSAAPEGSPSHPPAGAALSNLEDPWFCSTKCTSTMAMLPVTTSDVRRPVCPSEISSTVIGTRILAWKHMAPTLGGRRLWVGGRAMACGVLSPQGWHGEDRC